PAPALRFNLSHAAGLALYAFATGREVGVDLERIRHLPNPEGLAEMVFSPRERAVLYGAPAAERHVLFFNGWTRKEAYVKAEGDGLATPLEEIDVPLTACPPHQLLYIETAAGRASRWAMRALIPAPGFAGAVVAEGEDWQASYWQWLP
ncbi:MAG TPA: 4'-phosphopantetheinyl transferase superfamily protein, partial [Chloroflexota bacterium]|nr:4'-phosphopantetheinyl transferase superfamily protein [Chloroflexota bacterium]